MSDPQSIEKDLREYLSKEPNLLKEDKLLYLKAIFDKHFSITKLEHIINKNDLQEIIWGAKNEYGQLNLPIHVSGIRVDSSELPTLSVMEAFIGYLTKSHLLKKLVKVDYR